MATSYDLVQASHFHLATLVPFFRLDYKPFYFWELFPLCHPCSHWATLVRAQLKAQGVA